MRASRKKAVLKLVLFTAGLVLFRQGIATVNSEVAVFKAQSEVILANGIDPSALFYTESRLALAAEKEVRRRIASGKKSKSPLLLPLSF